jgi:hypothetical protein
VTIAAPALQHHPGFDVAFEREDETGMVFVHLWLHDGRIFGKGHLVRAAVPPGAFLSLDNPTLIWWFTKYAGFAIVAEGLRDDSGDVVTVLQRQEVAYVH